MEAGSIIRKEVFVMSKKLLEYVVTKAKELIAAPSCSAEAKKQPRRGLQQWERTSRQKRQRNSSLRWKKILFQLMDSSHLQSPMQEQKYSAERKKAKGVAEHGREIKAAGAKYCDCPACAAVEAILSKKEELLG
mgnify:CR=1 FL=1